MPYIRYNKFVLNYEKMKTKTKGDLSYDHSRLLCIAQLLQNKTFHCNSLRVHPFITGDAYELFRIQTCPNTIFHSDPELRRLRQKGALPKHRKIPRQRKRQQDRRMADLPMQQMQAYPQSCDL